MSILQQGDSQGELCTANVCKESVAVKGGYNIGVIAMKNLGFLRGNAAKTIRQMCNWAQAS